MKKIYSFTIVLVLVFIPLQAQIDKTFAEMGLSLVLPIKREGREEPNLTADPQNLLPFLMAIELILLNNAYELGESKVNKIPRYLSSLQQADIAPNTLEKRAETNTPNYVLNGSNRFQNTFFPWLAAVDYKSSPLHNQQQYSQGFGPRISI